MPDYFLTAYRRHLDGCEHKAKGQKYSLCNCPIWAYGNIPGKAGFRRSLQTSDAERARAMVDLLLRDGDESSGTRAMTFGDAVKLFISERSEMRENTHRNYRACFRLLASYSDVPLSQITTAAIDRHRESRLANVSQGTWTKELKIIRAFFKWAILKKMLTENPTKGVRMASVKALATPPFEKEEVTSLIDACDDLHAHRARARALVMLFLYSGLRISDVARLKRSALDTTTGYIALKITKTNERIRLKLPDRVVKALSAVPVISPDYFFWAGTGKPASAEGAIRRTIAILGKKTGIHAHPHRFRDTFAVELLTNGADIRTVQKLLGHESVITTEKHYARFMAAHQARLDSATATLDFERQGRGLLVLEPLKGRRRNT